MITWQQQLGILALSLVFLFLIGGYVWQALDVETFPDEDLPKWFVKLFRN